MQNIKATRDVLIPERLSAADAPWLSSGYWRACPATNDAPEARKAKRSKSRPEPITLREIAFVIGVVAISLWLLPRPLNSLTAWVLPPFYFLIRACPSLRRPLGLFAYPAWVAVPFIPAWITGDTWDFGQAKITLAATAPAFARFVIWRDCDELWYVLDPLVIASAPVAVLCILGLIHRLFEVGALSWS
jgi:hypothetical protein